MELEVGPDTIFLLKLSTPPLSPSGGIAGMTHLASSLLIFDSLVLSFVSYLT